MAVAKFSLATSERKKDKEGNWQDHTECTTSPPSDDR